MLTDGKLRVRNARATNADLADRATGDELCITVYVLDVLVNQAAPAWVFDLTYYAHIGMRELTDQHLCLRLPALEV